MKNHTKRPKFVARETRELVAKNVRARLDLVFPAAANQIEALAKRIGTSKSTVQRALSGEVGITIDVLAQLAMGLECQPRDLLDPIASPPKRR